MASSTMLGTHNVRKLIFSLGWPAALNFLVVAIYNLTDVMCVGRWVGSTEIAAVVVVGTITFLFSSFGLAIGVGGASIVSRALGEKNYEKAAVVLSNQSFLVLISSTLIIIAGWIFEAPILRMFGANGSIFHTAVPYYRILLFGVPFLSYSMMGNNVIHAEGKAKVAMWNSLLPTVLNIILNPVFILGFHMGIEGAAWATWIGYVAGFLLVVRFFMSEDTEIKIKRAYLKFDMRLIREIGEIGGTVLVSIVTTNLFVVVLNKSLFEFKQESGVVIYGIINRVNMLFLIPVIGIEGGIRPLLGYNFGSKQYDRIRETISNAIKYGLIICCSLLALVWFTADFLIHLFTKDSLIISETPLAMRIVFSFYPLVIIQSINTAYFQAIAKPQVAFYLTILRNLILLIPLLYIMPYFFGYYGILYTFPFVDILTTIPAIWLLRREMSVRLQNRVILT